MSERCCVQRVFLSRRAGAIAVLLGGLAALTLLWQGASQAGAPPFEPSLHAFFLKDKKLKIVVGLPGGEKKYVSANLEMALLDENGKTLDSQKWNTKNFVPHGGVKFDKDVNQADVNKLRVRVAVGKEVKEASLRSILLAKPHETVLNAGTEFHAGSPASLRCNVQAVRSLAETVPLPESYATIRLRDSKGKSHDVFSGKIGASGDVNFDVPSLEAGSYTMQIITSSPLGEETLERQVQIKADGKILLITDKPIYQPGQLMHLRALALRSFDMKPLANQDLLFEVEDSKGNKVFKRSFKTSEFGIASVDFQLADEVNMGDYNLHAIIGNLRADKTVQVKRYVLPKFKVEVKADKTYYLPKEKVHVDLQSDYFFGKPVADAKIEVTASTFDVAFKEFQRWQGKTDALGHAKFEIQLPDYFVGQPLQQGSAIVKLDVKILDTAYHEQTVTKSYAVSDQAIRVSVISEGGKLVPDMENRVFIAATYADGSPAPNTTVKLWHRKLPDAPQQPIFFRGGGRGGMPVPIQPPPVAPAKEEKLRAPLAEVKTNSAGLAELKLKTKADQFRAASWGMQDVEIVGGNQQVWRAQAVYDLRLEAQDPRGNRATSDAILNSQPLGENVLLRLDKAIYQTGDRMNIDVRTSAGLPTVFVDVVRGGQIMLSKWLEVKEGAAKQTLDLPSSVFGSLEIHAYQMLSHGEIIRDSRVIYVQPKNDLHVKVTPGKAEYEPGEDGRIRFSVTDAAGKPVAAALGIIVVDEAVYALQDLQPGLEKVYFTLQEELVKPKTQIKFSPGDTLDNIVRLPVIPAPRQQIAEVLLTAVKLPLPNRWEVNPGLDRKRNVEQRVATLAQVVFTIGLNDTNVPVFDKDAKNLSFRKDLFEDLVKRNQLQPHFLDDGMGGTLTMDSLAKLEEWFTPEMLARALTIQRLQHWNWQIQNYAQQNQGKFFKNGRWTLPPDAFEQALKISGLHKMWLADGYGEPLRLVKKDRKDDKNPSQSVFDDYDIVSTGADRMLGTKDDITVAQAMQANQFGWIGQRWDAKEGKGDARFDDRALGRKMMNQHMVPMDAFGGMPGGAGRGGFPVPRMAKAAIEGMPVPTAAAPGALTGADGRSGVANGPGGQATAPVTRIREFFPETMLWQPALITDDKGNADLAVSFADSITTWRLSASANSLGGAIGGADVPLKVFQDFFVDIDLPIFLTQSDEVAFPVAVYNYLKTPQTVKIELEREPWFDLIDDAGFTRTLNLKPNEVTSVKFRIRAGKIGVQPLTVKALGARKSDAVKRRVEVVPNGQKTERVVSDRLTNKVKQTLLIPDNALPDASKLFVRLYPGAMAQVVDGMDGMMQMPCGCFEQTSSSAYPNVLIVDYIKKNRIASPAMLMKAEQYLNVGYQRLLTFERPGGGFDWWGREAPLIWTSAYGLQQFSDMARVYPIDRGIIDRTQAFLMRSREKDATWSNIGATHGETIASMGNPKLLLTSYVTWSLLSSGYDKNQLKPSIDYIRANLDAANDNAYILALAANALAAYDAKDDSTLQLCQKLDKLRQEEPQWKVRYFPAKGTSLTYGRGNSVSVETTALAALAMLKTGQFNNSVNQSLAYLVKSKQAGTWGTTQATILALKALLAGMGGSDLKDDVHFTITVNGKEAVRAKIDKNAADVMQSFDIKEFAHTGTNEVQIEVNGETNLMYQIVSRHFEPWQKKVEPEQPAIDVKVEYDRTKLSTKDMLKAKATLRYNGKLPTYMVMLDLGIAPGFNVDPGDFADMVGKNKIKKFEITARQVIIYLGDVRPGDELTFEYVLRPRYPLRARTPATTAYEYNTPGVRSVANPVELTVE
jgi:hypothetical protein